MNGAGSGKPINEGLPDRAPKWSQRKSGAIFGFGGNLVQFGCKTTKDNKNKPISTPNPTIMISKIIDDMKLLNRSKVFENEMNNCINAANNPNIPYDPNDPNDPHRAYQDALKQLCINKSNETKTKSDEEIWKFMTILFEKDARSEILEHLGYNASNIVNTITAEYGLTPPSQSSNEEQNQMIPPPSDPDAFGVTEEENNVELSAEEAFNTQPLMNELPSTEESKIPETKSDPVIEMTPDSNVEESIKKLLLIGNFQAAVDCCMKNGQMANALLLATHGGPDLWEKTKNEYLEIERKKNHL
jgi:protein transport protein SEC31